MNMKLFRIPMPVWEAEGGGGGGGGAAAAAAAAAADGTGGQGDHGDGGDWDMSGPEAEIVGRFKGHTPQETMANLAKGYGELHTRAEGLRTQLASRPGAPAKPEDYTFTPGEEIKNLFGADPAKHAGINAAKSVFHKHGVSQPAFEGIINDLYGGMAKAGTLAAPYDANGEVKSYAEAGGFDAKTVSQHFTENETWAKGLINQLGDAVPAKLAAAAQAELIALTDTAGGNALIRALSARLAQNGFAVAGEGANQGGPLTEEELDKLTANPRIDPRNKDHQDEAKRFDPVLRKRYDDGMAARGRKKYGG